MILPLLLLGGGFLWAAKRRPAGAVAAAVPAPLPTPPALPGSPAEPKGQVSGGGVPLSTLKDIVQKGGQTAGIITLGLTLQEGESKVVQAIGGNEAEQNLTRVAGQGALIPIAAGKGAEQLAAAVGLGAGGQQTAKEIVGVGTAAAAVVGAPAFLAAAEVKAVAEGASWVIGKVAGKEAEKEVRAFVSEFDPTKTGSAAAAVVGSVGCLVGAIFGDSCHDAQKKAAEAAQAAEEAKRLSDLAAAQSAAIAASGVDATFARGKEDSDKASGILSQPPTPPNFSGKADGKDVPLAPAPPPAPAPTPAVVQPAPRVAPAPLPFRFGSVNIDKL